MNVKLWQVYIREGVVYLPSGARAEAGFLMTVEPITVVNADNRQGIEAAIIDNIKRGNPVVPTPDPFVKTKPELLKYANAKTWKTFEKTASLFSIAAVDDVYKFEPQKQRKDRGWETDTGRVEKFPAGTTIEEVARLATERIIYEAQRLIGAEKGPAK